MTLNVKNEPTVIEKFKRFYRHLNLESLQEIESIYSEDIIFIDPVHKIQGIDSMHSYFNKLLTNTSECRFEYLDQLVGDKSAYIKWNMYFRHPKLGGQQIQVKGVTQIQFNDRIWFHEDFYDLGEMFYENLPVSGWITKWLKQKLAAS